MKNIAASVAARLRNYAKDNSEVFDYVLNRYALERVLLRLSSSEHSDSFVLKGALLFYGSSLFAMKEGLKGMFRFELVK